MYELKSFDDRASLISAMAQDTTRVLRNALKEKQSAAWAVSGGNSPIPLFEAMNTINIDWENITIPLVDDRWVPEDHPRSNAAMVKRTLLQNNAAKAKFFPLYREGQSPFDCYTSVSSAYDASVQELDLAVLGMGPDGHTASLFPGAKGLEEAFNIEGAPSIAPIEAVKSDVTGDEVLRLTLSARALVKCQHLFLLLTGADKKEVFMAATDENSTLPIGRLMRQLSRPITVYYAD